MRRDIVDVDPEKLAEEFTPGIPRILVGCAPCQPFSKYTQAREDPKWRLLEDFATLITKIRPNVVSMENVPQLVHFKGGELFESFIRCLQQGGYEVAWEIAYCPNFGIPQSRSRLVLIASLHGKPNLPESTHQPHKYLTARDAIGGMPPLSAGEIHRRDSLHRASRLSAINMERIRTSTPGGTWRDWHTHLVTDCHKRTSGKGYAAVYGRMSWDEPAPTMTTQFYGFGSGRFGHPQQDRGISLREGAILQSFPRNYEFVAPGNVDMPTISNPVLDSEDFNRHWDQKKYNNFRNKFDSYNKRINDAFEEKNHNESVKQWRKLFGDEFGQLQNVSPPRVAAAKPWARYD